jgi:AcrR family transcriptional regulator
VRRHGWGGELPATDDEARSRIVGAAAVIVRATGVAPTVAQVADALSVSRATVYRYFPSAEALLLAAASDGLSSFLDDITSRVGALAEAADVVVEGVAYTLEEIDRRTELTLVLSPARGSAQREMTSMVAVELGRSVLEATAVDWAAAGFSSEAERDELAQFMLRMLQSLVLDPGDPPMQGQRLRRYLEAWVAPAVEARTTTRSNPSRRDSARGARRPPP